VSKAQLIFMAAFTVITAVITVFTLYVLSSTMWGGRWYRRPKKAQ